VTQTSGIVGNSAELGWSGSIQRDKFNQPITVYDRMYDLRQTVRNLGYNPDGLSEGQLVDTIRTHPLTWGDFNDPNRVRPMIHPTSSSYDPYQKYIPRSQRPEWTCVGLLGCMVVIEEIAGSCSPGRYVDCSLSGKAILGQSYRVLKRISSDTILIFFR
jgi:hypothetical protein